MWGSFHSAGVFRRPRSDGKHYPPAGCIFMRSDLTTAPVPKLRDHSVSRRAPARLHSPFLRFTTVTREFPSLCLPPTDGIRLYPAPRSAYLLGLGFPPSSTIFSRLILFKLFLITVRSGTDRISAGLDNFRSGLRCGW